MPVLLVAPLSHGASPFPSPGFSLLSDWGFEPDGLQACWLSGAPRGLWRGLGSVCVWWWGEVSGPQQTLCTQAIPSLPLCLSPRFPQVMPETPGLAAESSNNYSHLQKSVLLLITKPCNPNYTSKEASREPPSHGQPVSCSPRPSRIGRRAGSCCQTSLHGSLHARPCRKHWLRGLPWKGRGGKGVGGREAAPKTRGLRPRKGQRLSLATQEASMYTAGARTDRSTSQSRSQREAVSRLGSSGHPTRCRFSGLMSVTTYCKTPSETALSLRHMPPVTGNPGPQVCLLREGSIYEKEKPTQGVPSQPPRATLPYVPGSQRLLLPLGSLPGRCLAPRPCLAPQPNHFLRGP